VKRGAYFFVLDAFVAGIIIISSLTLLFNSFSSSDSPTQSLRLAEDFATFLDETAIKAYGTDGVPDLFPNPKWHKKSVWFDLREN